MPNSKIKNTAVLSVSKLRKDALSIIEAGLQAIDTKDVVRNVVQLTLGMDWDFAIVNSIANVIKKTRAKKKYIGICGQALSDYSEFARFLVKEQIDSISLNPDAVISTLLVISKAEKS